MSLIYHHTTTEGLIGILTRRKIWATDIEFLNDYEELLVGIKELGRVAKVNKEKMNGNNPYEKSLFDFYDIYEKNLRKNISSIRIFIASFTKTRDNLRQWMAYGRPNSSYSIAFKGNMLNDVEKIRSDGLKYCQKDVDYELDTLLSRSLDATFLKEKISEGNPLDEVLKRVFNDGMFGCCSVKRKEFSDENESRLIFQAKVDSTACLNSSFRNWGGIIVPYIEVPICIESIDEIIIGPNVNKFLAEKGLNNLLKSNGINPKISHSDCTLRQC